MKIDYSEMQWYIIYSFAAKNMGSHWRRNRTFSIIGQSSFFEMTMSHLDRILFVSGTFSSKTVSKERSSIGIRYLFELSASPNFLERTSGILRKDSTRIKNKYVKCVPAGAL